MMARIRKKNYFWIVTRVSAVVLVAVLGLTVMSKAVYHRSFMATCSEIYLEVIDRDAMYNDPVKMAKNIEERTVSNLQDVETPKLDVSIESRHDCGMQIFYINENDTSDKVIFYMHGGGYINPPASQHWGFIDKLAQQSGATIIMPIYFKCTNYTCEQSHKAIVDFYLKTADALEGKKIYIAGDSSGGGFALALSQQLLELDTVQPEEIILLSPWVDLTMTNEDMKKYADIDAMLGDMSGGIVLAEMWASDKPLDDPMVSPTFGNFEGLAPITVFIGTREVLYPDTMLLVDKIEAAGQPCTVHIGMGLTHVYPLFPIPEADEAIGIMADIVKGTAA